jgi:hypothetical protein
VTLSPEYVAGFFDGEGCVNITVRGKARQVALRVYFVNTELYVLEHLKLRYGGRIPPPRILKEGWKPFCSLVLVGHQAAALLEDIAPFVIVKRPQVELALEFWRFQRLPHGERNETVHLTPERDERGFVRSGSCPNIIRRKPEVLAKELEFKARMHALNKKGAA